MDKLEQLEKELDVNLHKIETLYHKIAYNIELGSVIMTDEAQQYKRLNVSYRHGKVNHSQGKYAFGNIHTNTIEGFWSQMKRGINGIYHWASTKHIDRYLAEYNFRYNERSVDDFTRFTRWFGICEEKNLSYQALIK
jgi:hypothetical protein